MLPAPRQAAARIATRNAVETFAVATPSIGDAEFLLASCPQCAKSVLTHIVDFDDADNEIRRCIHCDGEVDGDWRVVPAASLDDYGYGLVEARGCGNGGGCSSCGMRTRIATPSPDG